MDCSPPGSSVHGVSHAGILGGLPFALSSGPSWASVWTWVSCIAGRFFTIWATREAPQFSSVQLFVTPWTAARQASLSITNSWSLLKLELAPRQCFAVLLSNPILSFPFHQHCMKVRHYSIFLPIFGVAKCDFFLYYGRWDIVYWLKDLHSPSVS